MVYWKFQALNWSLTRFGLLEIWEWFIVPESELTSDPFELFPMLRDTNFVLVDYRHIGKAKIGRTDNNSLNTAPVAGCSSHFHAIFEFLGWIWSRSSYAVTLASCSPVFLDQLKLFFKKSCHGTHRTGPHLWSQFIAWIRKLAAAKFIFCDFWLTLMEDSVEE